MMHGINVRRGILLLALASLPLAAPREAIASPAGVGVIEKMERTVTSTRSGSEAELSPGSKIFASDIIRTGQIGYALVRLMDDTVIEMAPNSEISIVDVTFTAGRARLQLGIDRGRARVRTGSIGLKNSRGIDITTPKNLFILSNCILYFTVEPEWETVDVEWMPPGPFISVFNAGTGNVFRVEEQRVTLVTNSENEVSIEAMPDPDDEGAADPEEE
ncbi:MAG: FecR family protein [Synergistaceae bacterium]|jgi:hypothetical protein|nr:FecR family protein [Synergistaceae bacterium]